jgi:putative NADH-flavin reductase
MKTNNKIAVIGGGGRTGKYLVDQLLGRGFQIKLLLRNPEISKHIIPTDDPSIQVIKGDVLDYAAVVSLVKDCEAVISTIGQRKDEPLVASQATANILRSMAENSNEGFEIKRYILVAGLNVDTPFDKKGPETLAATEWMKSNFPLIHEDRQKAYRILEESNSDWTLVRVPYIEFTDNRSEVKVSLEDSLGKKISAADIAGFLIEQLGDKTYIRKSPFLASV